MSLNNKIKKQLERMKGNVYMYNTRHYKIIDYKIKHSKVEVVTDKEWFDFEKDEDILEILDDFLPVEGGSLIRSEDIEIMGDKVQLGNLKETLMHNIEKVKKDKGYIDQAKSINSSVQTLIKMAKVELEAIKLISKNN